MEGSIKEMNKEMNKENCDHSPHLEMVLLGHVLAWQRKCGNYGKP